jgi:hypothetical protein
LPILNTRKIKIIPPIVFNNSLFTPSMDVMPYPITHRKNRNIIDKKNDQNSKAVKETIKAAKNKAIFYSPVVMKYG